MRILIYILKQGKWRDAFCKIICKEDKCAMIIDELVQMLIGEKVFFGKKSDVKVNYGLK